MGGEHILYMRERLINFPFNNDILGAGSSKLTFCPFAF